MAYNFITASSQYLLSSASPVSSSPLTMACWFYAINNTGNRACVSVGRSGAGVGFHSIILNSGSASVSCISNAGTAQSANNSGQNSFSLNTWNHLCGVVSSSSLRSVFLNGSSVGQNTGTAEPTGLNSCSIGARFANGVIGQFMDGGLCEVGIWNAALTTSEINSLAKGITCDHVRPESLVLYSPLVRQLTDRIGGIAFTNSNGATVDNHPRIYT